MNTSDERLVIEQKKQQPDSRLSKAWKAVSGTAYNGWHHTTNFVRTIDPGVKAVSITVAAGMGMYGYFNIYATEFTPSALLYLATGGGLLCGALFQFRPGSERTKAFFANSEIAVKHTTKTMFQASMINAIEIATYQSITHIVDPQLMPVTWKVLLPITSSALGATTYVALHKLKNHKSDNRYKKAFVHGAFDASNLGALSATFGGDNLNYISSMWTPITAGILFTASACNQVFFANYPSIRTAGEATMKIFSVLSIGTFVYDNLVDPYALINHAITGQYDVPASYMIAMAVPTGIFVVCVAGSKALHAYTKYSEMNSGELAKLIQAPDDIESNQRSLPFVANIGELTANGDGVQEEKTVNVLKLSGGLAHE